LKFTAGCKGARGTKLKAGVLLEGLMKKVLLLSILVFVASGAAVAQALPTVSTFSIVAIDPQTGEMGVAVASRYFSVGSVVPWAMADVGAVATQANVNVWTTGAGSIASGAYGPGSPEKDFGR